MDQRISKTRLGGNASVFSHPNESCKITGPPQVEEIVIGLNRDDCANSLFTIDIEGRVIEHAKYSGEKATELLDAVKKTAQDSRE